MSLNLVERYYYTTYLLYSLIYLTVQLTISQFFDFQQEPLLNDLNLPCKFNAFNFNAKVSFFCDIYDYSFQKVMFCPSNSLEQL